MRPAVFLDRDGVLNKSSIRNGKPYAPRSARDFLLYPGTEDLLKSLKKAKFLLFVVTNQPDVGNGLTTKLEVLKMHRILQKITAIDAIETCFHSQTANCHCRKPRTGMLEKLSYENNVDLSKSYMVGDRHSDIIAGRTMGLKTIFIDRKYSELSATIPWKMCNDFSEATEIILGQKPFLISK